MPISPEEVEAARRRLGLAPARPDQQQQRGFQRQPTEVLPQPVQEKPTRGGVRGFVRRLTSPLVDVPELPGGFVGDIVEEGVESVTSPIGLLTTALVPVTGGASLGLKAGVGAAAKTLGTRFGAGVVSGGVGGAAAREVNERLPEGTPGILRIPATFGAAIIAGGGTGAVAGRLIGGGKAAAKAAAATAESTAAQSLGGFTPEADEVIAAVQAAKERLKDPLVRRDLKARRGAERSRRLSKGYEYEAETMLAGESGSARIGARLSAQKGELPGLDFPDLNIKPETIESLIDTALDSQRLLPYEQTRAAIALQKALIGGTAPARNELELLDKVFGPAFASALTKEQTFIQEVLNGILNLPRAVLATGDLSFSMNQGLVAAGVDSKLWGRSLGVSARAFADPDYQRGIEELVRGVSGTARQKKVAELAARADLHLTGKGATRDEYFQQSDKLMGKLLSKNIAGGTIEASERAYTTAGNYLRYNLFNKWVGRMVGEVEDEAVFLKAVDEIPYRDLKRVADTVNIITGRSPLLRSGAGAKLAPVLNATLFAPNYLISRAQLPFLPIQSVYNAVKTQGAGVLANPVKLWKSDPALQLQARALGGFAAESIAMMAAVRLAAEAGVLPGFKIETDPKSRRFGKIQTPEGDFDMLGGYSQIIAAVAQTVTGQEKTSTGVIRDVDPERGFLGDRAHVIWDKFIRSKVAPWPGLAWDVKTGKTFTGETLSGEPDVLDSAIRERLLPLAIQDVVDGYLHTGVKGAAFGAPALVGVRITSYQRVQDVKDDVAEERFGKPYAELQQAQRNEVDNHSKVLDKQREYELAYGDSFQAEVGNIQFQRAYDENKLFTRLITKTDTIDEFAKRLENVQVRASEARRLAAKRHGIVPQQETSLLDQAWQEWNSLYDIASSESDLPAGEVDFDKLEELRAALLKRLTPEQVKFIEDQEPADHDRSVDWYFNNKRYINESGYYDILDAEFSKSSAARKFESYDRLEAARDFATRTGDVKEKKRLDALLSPIKKRATAKKEALRRKDPNLDAALLHIGRTEKVLTPAAARLLRQ